MKKLLLLVLIFANQVRADSSALTSDFLSMLPRYDLAPKSEQSYCYLQNGEVSGYQVKKVQRIASLTKLMTTFFASELLNLNQQFTTKIYISGTDLHIEGGRDPYFEEEKFLLLMQSLNDLGYRKFRHVTFNSDFIFTDTAFPSHADITPAHTQSRLTALMSSRAANLIKPLWKTTSAFAAEEGITLEGAMPSISAAKVSLTTINPHKNKSPLILIHKSLPLHRILKSMNVMSKNHVAQNIFREASRIQSFTQFMQARGFPSDSFKVYNGSGLPVEGNRRLDNEASCELILNLSVMLEESVLRHQLALSDILAINGGKDLGSLRTRFLQYPETHQAVLSKTGTLKHTSSLAGMLMIEGSVPFAILNHTANTTSARSFQDEFVSRMFHHLGEPSPLEYQKISIFPWDGSPFLIPAASSSFANLIH